jgi:peptidoglycan/LPS O-acetylase OafA/YrhL
MTVSSSAPAEVSNDLPDGSHRFLLLDGMRGLAAIGVLSFHVVVDSYYSQLDSLYLLVDFFFVLSGFVLYPSIPHNGRRLGNATGKFVLKRVFRFWPLVIASLAVAMIGVNIQRNILISHDNYQAPYGSFFGMAPSHATAIFLSALFLLQVVVPSAIAINVPLWSLSAEWIANVVFAPFAAIKWGLGIVALVAFGYWMFYYGLNTDQEFISQMGPIRGLEALGRAFLGFGLGLLLRKFLPQLGRFRTWWLLILAIALLPVLNRMAHVMGYKILYWAAPIFALLILQVSKYRVKEGTWFARVLSFLGTYSFGIYVFHFPLTQLYVTMFGPLSAYALPDVATARFLSEATVVTFLSILITFIVRFLWEKPIQYWGKKLIARL